MKCFYASGRKRSAAWVLRWMPQLHKYKKGHLRKVYSGLWELQLSFCRHLGLLMFNDLLTEEKESKQCTCKNMTWCFVFHGSFNDWYRVKWSAWTLYDLQEWQKCQTQLLASEACIFAMLLPLFSFLYILVRFTRSIWTLWHLKPHPLSCQDVFHKEALSGSRISKLSQGNHTGELFELSPSLKCRTRMPMRRLRTNTRSMNMRYNVDI